MTIFKDKKIGLNSYKAIETNKTCESIIQKFCSMNCFYRDLYVLLKINIKATVCAFTILSFKIAERKISK